MGARRLTAPIRPKPLSIAIAAAMCTQLIWAADVATEEDMSLIYGDKSFVSIATGSKLKVNRAPSVATVISAEEIQASGVRDFDEIMEMVPGVHVERSISNYNPIYVIRGIFSQYNPQVLMLVNGLPMTSLYFGDRGDDWAGMPVENIARVEVIRGPGSALYGSDAFSGVINIITKTAADIGGTQSGLRTGSYRSHSGWVLHGGKWGPLDVAIYVQGARTDGARSIVEADQQSGLDKIFNTHASRAPGPINLGRDSLDTQLDISWENLRFRASQKNRDHIGTAVGIASALDPDGQSKSERTTADLSWQDDKLAENWSLSVQGSYFHYSQSLESPLTLFPAGAFDGAFPDGMIGSPSKAERHGRLTATAVYGGFNNHNLRIGAGYEKSEIYKVQESKNFTYAYIPGIGNVPSPLGAVVDFSNTAPFLRTGARYLKFAYIQDEWNLAKDWYLTAGLRHDQYSDFGGTSNPRLALVWEAAYTLTAKLLYGRAFRAPSYIELYGINNPVVQGNPDVKPEKIETIEGALSWQALPNLQAGLNVFKYQMRNILNFVANADPTTGATAHNQGSQTGHGLELDVTWDASRNLRVSANYAYQRSVDEMTHQDAGYAPHRHIYIRSDWRVWNEWSLDGQFNWVMDRRRAAGDSRPDIPNYRSADLTLHRVSSQDKWDIALSVRNIFNADVREPSLAPGLIPNDLPQAGRTFFIQARYKI